MRPGDAERSMEDFRDLRKALLILGALVVVCLLPLAV